MKSFKILAIAALFTIPMINAYAAGSATADAKQVVTAAIAITKVNDLDFGTAVQGDALKTVAPADGGAAAFTVTGEANKAFTLSYGAPSINMITAGGGSADKEIVVNAFASDVPAALDGDGSITVKVGATRAAIGASQVVGSYVGTFTVNVVY